MKKQSVLKSDEVLYRVYFLVVALLIFTSVGHAAPSFNNVDLTRYLPKGFVKDGTVDYTNYLQKGINENTIISFPNFPILINEKGLFLKNDQEVNFPINSKLLMKPNNRERYALINIVNVRNVTLNNPRLIGDRDKHLGTKGEWGMGINILSSANIKVFNPKVSNFWGDGIYVGEILHVERKNYQISDFSCRNIVIKGGLIDNNRRNGISIISVKGILVEDITIQNTNGTLPMAGIDIEPNNNEQHLEDITLRKVQTRNNAEVGIKYVSSHFLGKRSKRVSILIDNCTDFNSKTGLFIGGARSTYKGSIEKLTGEIRVNNFVSHSNQIPVKTGSIQKFNPKMTMESFTIYKKNKRDLKRENELKSELRSRTIQIK